MFTEKEGIHAVYDVSNADFPGRQDDRGIDIYMSVP